MVRTQWGFTDQEQLLVDQGIDQTGELRGLRAQRLFGFASIDAVSGKLSQPKGQGGLDQEEIAGGKVVAKRPEGLRPYRDPRV